LCRCVSLKIKENHIFMTFEGLKLIEPILQAIEKAGYTEPTKIQAEAIPPLLEGRDLLGCAQTGTGKTAAFAMPILQKLYNRTYDIKDTAPKALVLTPTRELAVQIGESFTTYGEFTGLKNTVVFGGVSQNPQVQALKSGVDILVATPGRLLDLLGQKLVDLRRVVYFVLDEADRMLDMGFLRDVERIINMLPEKKQTMLFSATMPAEIERLTKRLLKNPVKVAVDPVSSTVEIVDQRMYYVNKGNKAKLLIHLLKTENITSALVFTRTKHGANRLTEQLRAAGESCEVIHANKAQSARQQALGKFKSGISRVLVATDIVSRGIDIIELSHVVNYDLPESPEDYVHRIGRTGRAGLAGTAISFCDLNEIKNLDSIEKLIGKRLEVVNEHPYILHDEPPEPPEKPRDRSHEHGRAPHGRSGAAGSGGGYRGNRRGSSGRSPDRHI
jgi:ATP-dependent RNA helicase RhlE